MFPFLKFRTVPSVRNISLPTAAPFNNLSAVMLKELRNTWYVSCRLVERLPKEDYSRPMAESFPKEAEAKKFARSILAEAQFITAGTLNPYLPKHVIAPRG